MGILQTSLRTALKAWGKSGVAMGYLYQTVDQVSGLFHHQVAQRKIRNGVRIDCDLSDHVQSRIYFMGAYEPIETYLFSRLMGPGSVIVDAGANIGFYSLFLAGEIDRAVVHSFEPVPVNFAKLQAHVEKNNFAQKIFLHKKGLWHQPETLKFSLADGNQDNVGAFAIGEGKGFECQVMRLDDFVTEQKLTRVDFIKMDIEGAELFALQGATKTLGDFKPALLLEINTGACAKLGYKTEDLWQLLAPLGYKFYKVGYNTAHSGFVKDFSGIEQGNILALQPAHEARLLQSWNPKTINKFFARA